MNQLIVRSQKLRSNGIWALALLMVLVAASGNAATKKIIVDYDENVDFSKFKTFALSDEGMPFVNEEAGVIIRQMVAAELETKGLRAVEIADADFRVVLFPSEKDGMRVDWYSMGYMPWWGMWGGGIGVGSRTTDIKVGSMLIDIVDAGQEKLVWRGTIDVQLKDDIKKNIDKVMGAIESVFKHFPPKK